MMNLINRDEGFNLDKLWNPVIFGNKLTKTSSQGNSQGYISRTTQTDCKVIDLTRALCTTLPLTNVSGAYVPVTACAAARYTSIKGRSEHWNIRHMAHSEDCCALHSRNIRRSRRILVTAHTKLNGTVFMSPKLEDSHCLECWLHWLDSGIPL